MLLAAGSLITEVPKPIAAKLLSAEPLAGEFVQTKTVRSASRSEVFRTKGEYRIIPGKEFSWKTIEPFETLFVATRERYTYSNEDESVTRELADLPQMFDFGRLAKGDLDFFFEVFEARYLESNGRFRIEAKPKPRDLAKVLEKVEVEGTLSEWSLKAIFPNSTEIRIDLRDAKPMPEFPANTTREERTVDFDDRYPEKKLSRDEVRGNQANGRLVRVKNVKSRESAEYYRSRGVELFGGDERLFGREPNSIDDALAEVRKLDVACEDKWFGLESKDEVAAYRKELKAKMIEAIGGLPERTPLNPVTVGSYSRDGYRFEKVRFESQPNHHVTAYLVLPSSPRFKPPYPAILEPLGHANNGKERPGYFKGGVVAAKAGFATLIYDPVDQGERAQLPGNKAAFCVGGHVNAGMRSHLVGWNFSRFRIWDAMRAIDYLESRGEIDSSRIGVMGQSGGGTLTAYVAALDPRIKVSCPAGFVTTMRDLAEVWGPQDSEQNIPGALKLGINHLSLMLMASPMPVMMVLAQNDAFPIYGSRATWERLYAFHSRWGTQGDVAFTMEPNRPHGWYDSSRNDSVRWIRRAFAGVDAPVEEVADAEAMPPEGDEAHAAPGGMVMNLPGERSVYDIIRDRLAELEAAWPKLTRERLLALTGINPDAPRGKGERLELVRNGYWSYVHSPADELAALYEWMGRSLVAERAERMIAEAREFNRNSGGRKMRLKADGHMAIPAAHAWYVAPELFEGIEITDPPVSWREAVVDSGAKISEQDLVFGALKLYDWTDLVAGENPGK
jgi:dienelactone hydrolase